MTTRKANWKGMNWISQHKRLAIYIRDGSACAYCNHSVEEGAQLSLDHLKCDVNGGTNHETNLVTCCSRCNSARGDRPVRSFCKAVAQYRKDGRSAADIEKHVRNCAARKLDVASAKEMVARRGSAAKVLKSM